MKSLGNFPDPFIAEISGQPDALRRAASALHEQRATLEAIAGVAPGRTVVLTGMGSSYDACYAAVAELARAGIGAIMLDAAELLHFRTRILGPDSVLVAVSQSGASAEVVHLVTELPRNGDRPTVIGITNGVANPLASLADHAIDTRAGPESGPSTMTFAASLVAVSAVACTLARGSVASVVERLGTEAEIAAVAIDRLLRQRSLPETLVSWLGNRETLVILGRGPARAAAEMGALTLKEAVGMPVESLETGQFRHGPLELAGPRLAVMVIATEPETLSLDLALAQELLITDAGVLVVTQRETPVAGAIHVATGPLDPTLGPAVSIVPAQLLAWKLAGLRGREPGVYYRAHKVTTRE